MRIKCECGHNCDYEASTYETVNKLACNNSRINETIERDCMNCEETFKTTNQENSDYCQKCR